MLSKLAKFVAAISALLIYIGVMINIVSAFFQVHFLWGFTWTLLSLMFIYRMREHLFSSAFDRNGTTRSTDKLVSRAILASGAFAIFVQFVYVGFFL